MKYFENIYEFIKDENASSYYVSDEKLNKYEKEENCILNSIGKNFAEKYHTYCELHDCPLMAVKIDFDEQEKCVLSVTFKNNEEGNPIFTIRYNNVYDYGLEASHQFIKLFNMIKGNKCLISEFSKTNKLYTHEIAFSDGSKFYVRFRNPRDVQWLD